MKGILISLLILIGNASEAAIVNIEDLRPNGQDIGGSGKLDFSFSRSHGNTNVLTMQVQNAFAWVREANESLFILNYRYGESGDVVNVNQGLGHLRHVRPINEMVAFEVFTQAQKDEFKRLNYRVLAGGNLRLKLTQAEHMSLFVGLGAFHSHEQLSGVDPLGEIRENALRANSYLSGRYAWSEEASVSSTVYYQPRGDKTDDFHILWDNSLRVHLVQALHLKLSYELGYDSNPPAKVEGADQRYFSGLSWGY